MKNINNYLYKKNDFLRYNVDNKEYVFFSDTLQIFKIDNEDLIYFFNLCNNPQKENNLKIENIKSLFDFLENSKKESKPIEKLSIDGLKLNSLIFHLTNDCNLKCFYFFIFEKENKEKKMTFNTAKKAIDFLLKKSPDEKTYSIMFFGGEPLLEYKLMKDIVNYSKKIMDERGKKIYFTITTNGTIFNNEIISFLKENNFNILISLDGPEDIHNKHRIYKNNKGSFSKIIELVELLKNSDISFNIRNTITPDNENIVCIMDFFEKSKLNYGFGFAMNSKEVNEKITSYKNNDIENFKTNYKKLIDYFYNKIINKEEIYNSNIPNCLLRIDAQIGKEAACTSGKSTLSITSDDSIYSCQCIINHNDAKIGNLFDGIDTNKHSVFQAQGVKNIIECQNCWCRYLCSGGCYYEHYIENNTTNIPAAFKCEITKIQWEYLIKLYHSVKNVLPEYFDTAKEITKYEKIPFIA